MSMEEKTKEKAERSEMWFTILWYMNLYCLSIYGLWLAIFEAQWMTVFFAIFITMICFIGTTIGAHRHYAHCTFTASRPLKIFFVFAHTLAGVGSIYNWVLLHRIHHKYYKTDKDPYNHNKGFLHAHVLSNFNNEFLENENLVKSIDMRDLGQDLYVWVQYKFYVIFFLFITLFWPIIIPVEYWNESVLNSFFVVGILRLAIAANMSWLVNSACLVWGLKSTDKYPIDDFSIFYVEKSYWPNYHYLYPRDWKSSEYGEYNKGFGTNLIKFFYTLGLVKTLTTLSTEDTREALYKIACKKNSVKECLEEVEKISEQKATNNNLRIYL